MILRTNLVALFLYTLITLSKSVTNILQASLPISPFMRFGFLSRAVSSCIKQTDMRVRRYIIHSHCLLVGAFQLPSVFTDTQCLWQNCIFLSNIQINLQLSQFKIYIKSTKYQAFSWKKRKLYKECEFHFFFVFYFLSICSISL